jgi:hypothetical protein
MSSSQGDNSNGGGSGSSESTTSSQTSFISATLQPLPDMKEVRKGIRNGTILNELLFNVIKKNSKQPKITEDELLKFCEIFSEFTSDVHNAYPSAKIARKNMMLYIEYLAKNDKQTLADILADINNAENKRTVLDFYESLNGASLEAHIMKLENIEFTQGGQGQMATELESLNKRMSLLAVENSMLKTKVDMLEKKANVDTEQALKDAIGAYVDSTDKDAKNREQIINAVKKMIDDAGKPMTQRQKRGLPDDETQEPKKTINAARTKGGLADDAADDDAMWNSVEGTTNMQKALNISSGTQTVVIGDPSRVNPKSVELLAAYMSLK